MEKVTIEGVELHLTQPDLVPMAWVGQEELVTQVIAAWLVIGDDDFPLSSVEAGAAWNNLDKATQDKFIDDYRNRRNRRELYDKYVEIIGGAAILDYLELIDPRCHGKAHALGNAIFAKNQDLNLSLRICGNRCTNACMHGVAATEAEFARYFTRQCWTILGPMIRKLSRSS